MERMIARMRTVGFIEEQIETARKAERYGKEIIAAGLDVRNLVLIPALA